MTTFKRRIAILVWSGKGGVGKSTIAAALALALRHAGVPAGLLDIDTAGPSAPILFGLTDRLRVAHQRIQPAMRHDVPIVSAGLLADPGYAFVWRGHLLRGAITQLLHDTDWGDTRLLVVDLPPGTGEAQLAALDLLDCVGAVVVTTPHDTAHADTRRSLRLLDDEQVPVLAIAENLSTLVCPNCGHEHAPFPGDGGIRLAVERPDVPYLRFPLDSNVTAVGVNWLRTKPGAKSQFGEMAARLAHHVSRHEPVAGALAVDGPVPHGGSL